METVKVEILVGKESKDIVDAIVNLIQDFKAKKDIASIAAENLPGLMAAVTGYESLGAEMQSASRNETVAYAGLQIAETLAPDNKQEESAE